MHFREVMVLLVAVLTLDTYTRPSPFTRMATVLNGSMSGK